MSGERQLTSSSLVKAEVSDIPELVGFLIGMHDEAETLYPPYDKFLMSKFIKPIVDKELCILLKKDKKIIGAIGGQERRWWFSHNKYLGDAFFFISKNPSILFTYFQYMTLQYIQCPMFAFVYIYYWRREKTHIPYPILDI